MESVTSATAATAPRDMEKMQVKKKTRFSLKALISGDKKKGEAASIEEQTEELKDKNLGEPASSSSSLTAKTFTIQQGPKAPLRNDIVAGLLSDFNENDLFNAPLLQSLHLICDWITYTKDLSGHFAEESHKESFDLCLKLILILNKADPTLFDNDEAYLKQISVFFELIDENFISHLQSFGVSDKKILLLHAAAKDLLVMPHKNVVLSPALEKFQLINEAKVAYIDLELLKKELLKDDSKVGTPKNPVISEKKGSSIQRGAIPFESAQSLAVKKESKNFSVRKLTQCPAIAVVAAVVIAIAAYVIFNRQNNL